MWTPISLLRRKLAQFEKERFPVKQLFVLALCRICEPIAFMSIFPYAYYMIASFKITDNDTQIAVYAGMLTSSFAFAEFSTGVVWGRISDRFGRKPVLITGLFGTALSMIMFGFSRNLQTALLARALGGFLNGNVGVLQTTVAELVTNKEHQPRAYSIMPFVWCLGSIIGPALGGGLAQPCQKYPRIFGTDSIFYTYPFLLSNLICVLVLICGIVVGILFLEETHSTKKHRKDYGLELGDAIFRKLVGGRQTVSEKHMKAPPPYTSEQPPEYRSREGSPRASTTSLDTPPRERDAENGDMAKQDLSLGKIFNRQIIFLIIGYGILAFHSVSFDQLMPVLLSQPKTVEPPSLPFHLSGGFALSTKTIGWMMAVQGLYSMVAQLWLFPAAVRRLGTLRTFRMVISIWPFLDFAVPYLVLLPSKWQILAVYVCLIVKITLHVIAFPSMNILLTNSVPSKLVLGTIHGVAASTACLARAFGPTVTGLIHSAGLRTGWGGLAWWACGLVCAVGAVESSWMEEPEGFTTKPIQEEEPAACEPLLHLTSVEAPDEEEAFFVDQRRGSTDSIGNPDASLIKL